MLLPHLQTGRLRLEHLSAVNQLTNLLRTVGEMLGMALCEKTQHLHIARALLLARHLVAVLTQEELAHLLDVLVQQGVVLHATLDLLLEGIDLLVQLLHVRRHERHCIVGDLTVAVVYRLVQDRLPLHHILLDRIGEELALQFRIIEQKCIAQRHNIAAVGGIVNRKTQILVFFVRSCAAHESEHLTDQLVEQQQHKSRDRYGKGDECLGQSRDPPAITPFQHGADEDHDEVYSDEDPSARNALVHHSD